MRFTEIGQQLRAYRLESGLRAEEIAARLGVSRAALYRYEKGEVIKLDTVKRLAELLKISPLSLLGIGVEYYSRPIGYLERLRQLEETADQILQVAGPICYLTTSDAFDGILSDAFAEQSTVSGLDPHILRGMAEQVLGMLAARKKIYSVRRPSIIAVFAAPAIETFLQQGVCGSLPVSESTRRVGRQVALREAENIAALMEAEPMGLQFGLLPHNEPSGNFIILRARDRAHLAISPFRPEMPPTGQTGVAMITAADEAVAVHQRVAEANWREVIKGAPAAERMRQIINAATRPVMADHVL
jgi:transcriptional regulator with XRE-family HTH domain